MTHSFNFTRRQHEIADLIRAGRTQKSLAERLVVEKGSISRQLLLMYMLAGVHSFSELREKLQEVR